MINLDTLNSKTELNDYNCGGFALGCLNWYVPEAYDNFSPHEDDIDKMIYNSAEEIIEDFPELFFISHHSKVPDDYDVIGFRISMQKIAREVYDSELKRYRKTDDTVYDNADLHFILRSEGKWYHKPGNKSIREVDFNVDKKWPYRDGKKYNSHIIWFARKHKEIEIVIKGLEQR